MTLFPPMVRRAKSSTGEDAQKELLDNLKTKVREVYESCGFDAESDPSTLTMYVSKY